MRRNNAFTLVEIANVSVIIGLLLGGAPKARKLVNNAKARAPSEFAEGGAVCVH